MSVTRSFSGTALDRIYFDKLTHPMALAVRGGTASLLRYEGQRDVHSRDGCDFLKN
jgi:hypothetical protein